MSEPDRDLPDRLVIAGSVLFGVGAVAVVATVLPLLLGTRPMPTAVYVVAAVCCPLGLAVALFSLLMTARRRRYQEHDDPDQR